MDAGICMWLCRLCHDEQHTASSIAEAGEPLKRGGYCRHCGQHVYGGWDRAKTLGLDYCICRKCYKKMKGISQQVKAGQLSLL